MTVKTALISRRRLHHLDQTSLEIENTNRKSDVASRTPPSACCCCDGRKCPKSFFGTCWLRHSTVDRRCDRFILQCNAYLRLPVVDSSVAMW